MAMLMGACGGGLMSRGEKQRAGRRHADNEGNLDGIGQAIYIDIRAEWASKWQANSFFSPFLVRLLSESELWFVCCDVVA
jgi:hypothetical protein